MPDELAAHAAGIGLLADPVRRSLYDYVVGCVEPVTRTQAADGVGLAEHTAKFHLDRLVDGGLLTAEYRRLPGRSGPGAGRPSKLYRRADREVEVTLPARRYELAGHVLAEAVSRAAASGTAVLDAVTEAATDAGRALAASAAVSAPTDDLNAVVGALAPLGFEPRRQGPDVVLANCPFHALVAEHTELVCRMNHALLDGLADALPAPGVRVDLEPAAAGEHRCCVVLHER